MEDYRNKYDVVSDIYDQYVSVDFDISFWVNEGRKAAEVLELTSGTGRITIPLARAGVKVTALDVSSTLLKSLREKARKEGLDIEVVQADIRTFHLNRSYPLIILPFQSIQELITRRDQLEALGRISEHLQDNGHFMVSIHNPKHQDTGKGEQAPLAEFQDSKTGRIVKFFNSRSVKDHLATNEQVYREYEGNQVVSERKFINRSYVFYEGEFEDLLNEAGFRVDCVWGGYNYEPPGEDSRFLVYRLAKK